MRIVSGEKDAVKVSAAINDAARRLDTTDVRGTTTNDNASAGNIGEYIEADLPQGSPISLTTVTPKNIVSVPLTPGDWDVAGVAYFFFDPTTTISWVVGSLSATSATLDLTQGRDTAVSYPAGSVITNIIVAPIMPIRFNVAVATPIYLVGDASFAVSTMTAWGHIRARRAR